MVVPNLHESARLGRVESGNLLNLTGLLMNQAEVVVIVAYHTLGNLATETAESAAAATLSRLGMRTGFWKS